MSTIKRRIVRVFRRFSDMGAMSPYVIAHALEKPPWRTDLGGWIGRLYRNRRHHRHESAGQHPCVVHLLSGGWIGMDLAGNLGFGLGQEGRRCWQRLE